ncbi:LysE family translocator [Mesonia aquimarina]|uniref:LysE family translocator n=1 Tax=Mesonia aquimarina TaxID=1504967 RepID=UPI000EF6170A|nr:LysE family transporter [Mesonia aquimarina]
MIQDIFAAVPLGIFLAFLLGPVFFVLLETAAIKGFRAAVFFDIGVILSDVVFLLIAYFSTSKLLNSIKDDPGLFIFGGCILATYGIVTFVKEKKAIPHPDDAELRKLKKSDFIGLVVKGFLLNFVNIGVLGFWLGLIIVFGPTMDMNPERLLVFFTAVIVTYFIIDILKILLAKKLNHKLTPIRIYRLKKGISILIVFFGVILISRGLFPSEMDSLENKVEEIMPGEEEV